MSVGNGTFQETTTQSPLDPFPAKSLLTAVSLGEEIGSRGFRLVFYQKDWILGGWVWQIPPVGGVFRFFQKSTGRHLLRSGAILSRPIWRRVWGIFGWILISPKNPVFSDFGNGPDRSARRTRNLSGWYPKGLSFMLDGLKFGSKKCFSLS